MKILVVQQKRIGDVLISTALCSNLRRELPDAEIHYMIFSFTQDVVLGNPAIDELVLYEDEDRKLPNLCRFALKIRRARYDVIIDPYAKAETQFIARLSGAKTRISFRRRMGAYNVAVPESSATPNRPGMAIYRRLELLRPLVGDEVSLDPTHRIYLSASEIERGRDALLSAGLDPERPIVFLGLFGSVVKKSYPDDYMLELVDWVMDRIQGQLVLDFYPDQHQTARLFRERIAARDGVFVELGGRELRDLAAMLAHTDFYIGNDSGRTHIAKSMGVPTFTVFSPAIRKLDWGVLDEEPVHDSVDAYELLADEMANVGIDDVKRNLAMYYSRMRPKLIIQRLEDWIDAIPTDSAMRLSRRSQPAHELS